MDPQRAHLARSGSEVVGMGDALRVTARLNLGPADGEAVSRQTVSAIGARRGSTSASTHSTDRTRAASTRARDPPGCAAMTIEHDHGAPTPATFWSDELFPAASLRDLWQPTNRIRAPITSPSLRRHVQRRRRAGRRMSRVPAARAARSTVRSLVPRAPLARRRLRGLPSRPAVAAPRSTRRGHRPALLVAAQRRAQRDPRRHRRAGDRDHVAESRKTGRVITWATRKCRACLRAVRKGERVVHVGCAARFATLRAVDRRRRGPANLATVSWPAADEACPIRSPASTRRALCGS